VDLFSYEATQGRVVDRYGSIGAAYIPLIRNADILSVVSIWIEPQGILGLHPAAADQLFLVAAGEGFVSSVNQDELPVKSGMAVLWHKGEMHQTRAGNLGLLAVVIEGEGLAGSMDISLTERDPEDSD
jgi:mannose-6-phosphate isomerase-like protein (cupin superfamily)